MKVENDKFQESLRATSAISREKSSDGVKLLKVESAKGVFRMTANEGGQYAVVEIECEGDLKPTLVPAHKIENLALLFDKSVSIDLVEGRVRIRSSGSIYHVPIQSKVEEFPEVPKETLTKLGVNCVDLADCIDMVKFASKKTDERPTLYGVNVTLSPTKIVADASTGLVMAHVEKASVAVDGVFLIPYPFINNVVTALRKTGAVLSVTETRIMVEYEGGCYSCALLASKFPNFNSGMGTKHPQIGKFNPSTWLATFRSILNMAGEEGKLSCAVSVKEGRVKYEGTQGVIDRPTDKLTKGLQLNATTFVAVLEAFGDVEVKASVYENGSLRLDHGDLTVFSTQLRA